MNSYLLHGISYMRNLGTEIGLEINVIGNFVSSDVTPSDGMAWPVAFLTRIRVHKY